MTAKEARELSDLKKKKDNHRIMEEIQFSAQTGKYYIYWYDNNIDCDQLREMGYIVENNTSFKDGILYTISW